MASLWDTLSARAKQAWQYAGQVPAGLVQGTLADSHVASDVAQRKAMEAEIARRGGVGSAVQSVGKFIDAPFTAVVGEDYRPAIVDQIPALYGVIKSVLGKDVDPNSVGGKGMERANSAVDRTNSALGIKDPENAAQMGLNIIGSLIAPGGKMGPATAATKGGRIAQRVGKVAVETALPLRQTGVKTALATQIPIGVGLREGIEAVAPTEEYRGVADLIPDRQQDEFGDTTAPVIDEFGDVPAASVDEFGEPLGVPSADDVEMSTLEKGVLGAATVAAAGLGLHFARRGMSKINNPVPEGELVGSRVVSTRGGTGEKLQTAVAQHDQPARNAATEFLTPDEADRFKFNSDRIIPQALGAKIKSAIGTGQFPGTTVRVQPLAPLYEAISKDLDQTEYKMLADGLLAKSALDDINNSPTGVQASFTDKTPAELQALAALVDNDPKLSKYADLIREQYKGLLDYRKEMGFLDGNMYQEFRNKRPNYVHLSRDVTREGGPEGPSGLGGSKLDEMFTRGEEASSGVQVGATTDPIAELQNRYAQTIRAAELNQHKLQFFDDLTRSRAIHETVPTNDGSIEKFITELPDAPKTLDGVHAVYDGGRVRYFKVGDPALDRALRYAPKATAGVFGTMRQVAQFFTTGAGNPLSMFGATVSPVYDTLSGMVLRPAGTDLGVINEVLNRVGSPFNLGVLDPSILASAPIGAVRRAFDGMTEGFANSLSDQLIRDHGAVLDVLGPQKTTALRDMLKSKYQSSIRSMLEQEGVSSSQQWGADSGRGLPIGLHEMAPNYYADLSRRATAEALKGDYKFHEGVLAQGKNAFAQAKASKIARMYGAVLQNMQEGFRYQFAATNMPKVKSMRDMNELMSQTRRIASDTGQFGGSDAWNKVADSAMYANVGMQAINEWARKFAQQPGTTITNLTTTIAMLAALRYGAMYSDPEIAKEVRSRTDAQNTAKIITPGGIELPVEPMMRMATGPLFAVLDNMVINPDGTMDPNFGSAIFQYFDDDDAQERGGQAAWDAFKAGGSAALPLSPNSVPAANAVLAMNGVDPGLTRVTGEPVQIRPQQTDPLGGTGKTANSMMDAYWGKVLESMTGSSVTNMVDIADQWQRAAYSQNRDGSRGVSPAGAVKVALSQAVDSASKTSSPAQSLLFKDYDKVKSIADTDYKLYQGKKEGMDKAMQIMKAMKTSGGDDVEAYITGTDPRYAMVRPIDLVPPDYVRTPLAPIAAITAQYGKEIRKVENLVSAMTKQMNDVRSQVGSTIEQRNQQLNEINKERRYYYGRMLQLQRQAEDAIGQQIGDENFTYQNFEAERYLPKPMQQSTGPAPQ